MEKESKQAGATEEQPKEEISTESKVTSPEAKETSTKPRTEDEFKTMQSLKDKAEAKALKEEQVRLKTQNQLQELQNRIEADRQRARQKELDGAKDDPEALSVVQRQHAVEDDKRINEAKWEKALALASQYGIEDISNILTADTPKEMELMAKLSTQSREQAKAVPPSTQESDDWTPDSNLSDVGGKRTWTQDEVANLSSEEYSKHQPDIEKALREGRIK